MEDLKNIKSRNFTAESRVYNIELSDINRVESSALNVSSGGSFYVAKVKESNFEKMKYLGWTEFGEL